MCSLRICQLIVISLGRILREVLYELPVIAFGIVEVDALPVRVRVRDSRFSVAGCFEPRAQRLDVIHLIGKVVHSRLANVRDPCLSESAFASPKAM